MTGPVRAPRRATQTPLHLTPIDRAPVLQHALAQAAQAAEVQLAAAGHSSATARAVTAALCTAAHAVLDGAVPTPPAGPVTEALAEVRRSLLAQSRSGALAPSDAITLIDALEAVGLRLTDSAAHRFTARLSGADGLTMLVDVAHDMRSPLGSILFLAEQLRQGRSGAVSPVQERQLGLIYGAALGLSTLASDVIDLARGGESLVGPAPAPFSLGSVLRQVHDLVRPMAEERQLEVTFTSSADDARLGHARALHRVLLNLVTNAIKFTDHGTVSVTATPGDDDTIHFRIVDTGRGIPDPLMHTLFDTWRRRLAPGQYMFSSAGLGLAICQHLVRAMGSDLIVTSVLGEGTTFAFALPLPAVATDT